ncbi:metalloregulator ArsR/SmtB family transcription factor [Streptomyces sp. N2-109]|uniref:Metalloregulator ArsR/SmtB family transcription factor n=1 Tax=Streptomyces gossypii TaxID=2883101 RepID=A0ABT2JWI4_9ACTN|nr:metalloregulator ArsR/SmtB family transcription factor [Streptomyces gossypii]MCT2592038.1 metalloregulator ArsR/SmtB family transcription factor [Streptomyces gossypii]
MAFSWDPGGECSRGENMAATVSLFHSLGDTIRLAILQRLACSDALVTDLVATLGLPRSTVSAHLSCLMDCGLVDFRTTELDSVYYLAQPELIDLLNNAGQLLAAAGANVAFGSNHGTPGEGTP